jgi:hypothetical protein
LKLIFFHNILVLTFSLLLQIFRYNVYKCIYIYMYMYIYIRLKIKPNSVKGLAIRPVTYTVWFCVCFIIVVPIHRHLDMVIDSKKNTHIYIYIYLPYRYLSFYWKKWFYIWYMALAWWLVPCLPFPGLPHIYFLFTVPFNVMEQIKFSFREYFNFLFAYLVITYYSLHFLSNGDTKFK